MAYDLIFVQHQGRDAKEGPKQGSWLRNACLWHSSGLHLIVEAVHCIWLIKKGL
jgi:hypothetical protein